MIRLILSIFSLFRWFIEKTGADYNQFMEALSAWPGMLTLNAFSLSIVSIIIAFIKFGPVSGTAYIDTLTSLDFNASNLVFTIGAIAVHVAAIFITSRYLTPEFNKKLLYLEQGDSRGSNSLSITQRHEQTCRVNFQIDSTAGTDGIIMGYIKATFAKYFIPIYMCVGIAICSVWGIRIVPDVLIVFTSLYLFTLSMFYTQRHFFPFAMEKSSTNGDMYLKGLLAAGVLVAYGFFHNYLINLHSFANLLLIPINLGLYLCVSSYFLILEEMP